MKLKNIGVLGFQGDFVEHIETTKKALNKLSFEGNIIMVKTKDKLQNLDGLIIPGGESTTLQTLCIKTGCGKI